ncbi:MAG: DUF1820 family protein [Gammaproteobacteria bacterium]
MAKKQSVFKVIFFNQGKIYEVYAKGVSQSGMMGFVEVEGLLFGEKSAVLVDPAEERLKSEFDGVSRTYIPMHAVVRIDEVEKEGVARITDIKDQGGKVTPFPMPGFSTSGDDKS